MWVCVCVSIRSFLPPQVSRPQNIGTYVFTATRGKTSIIVIFAKNVSFRSYSDICLMHTIFDVAFVATIHSKLVLCMDSI